MGSTLRITRAGLLVAVALSLATAGGIIAARTSANTSWPGEDAYESRRLADPYEQRRRAVPPEEWTQGIREITAHFPKCSETRRIVECWVRVSEEACPPSEERPEDIKTCVPTMVVEVANWPVHSRPPAPPPSGSPP